MIRYTLSVRFTLSVFLSPSPSASAQQSEHAAQGLSRRHDAHLDTAHPARLVRVNVTVTNFLAGLDSSHRANIEHCAARREGAHSVEGARMVHEGCGRVEPEADAGGASGVVDRVGVELDAQEDKRHVHRLQPLGDRWWQHGEEQFAVGDRSFAQQRCRPVHLLLVGKQRLDVPKVGLAVWRRCLHRAPGQHSEEQPDAFPVAAQTLPHRLQQRKRRTFGSMLRAGVLEAALRTEARGAPPAPHAARGQERHAAAAGLCRHRLAHNRSIALGCHEKGPRRCRLARRNAPACAGGVFSPQRSAGCNLDELAGPRANHGGGVRRQYVLAHPTSEPAQQEPPPPLSLLHRGAKCTLQLFPQPPALTSMAALPVRGLARRVTVGGCLATRAPLKHMRAAARRTRHLTRTSEMPCAALAFKEFSHELAIEFVCSFAVKVY